jgi:hypothetical protein
MYYLVAFRELFICIGMVVIIGGMMGLFIARDQYNANSKINSAIYERPENFHEAGYIDDHLPDQKLMATVSGKIE